MHCLILQLALAMLTISTIWTYLDLAGIATPSVSRVSSLWRNYGIFSHFWHSIRHFVLDTIELNFYACKMKKNSSKNRKSLGIPDISFPWLSPVPMHTWARSQYFNHLKTVLLLHSKHSAQFFGGVCECYLFFVISWQYRTVYGLFIFIAGSQMWV